MVNEEIYVLVKHGNFDAEYIENLPIYRRRKYLEMLQKENDKMNEIQSSSQSKYKR